MKRPCLMGILLAIALAGCSRENAYEAQFTEGCLSTSGGNTKYCKCVLSGLEERHPASELPQLDREGRLAREAAALIPQCLRQ